MLEALKNADVSDRIRTASQTIYQALIDAELTAVIGPHPSSGPKRAWPIATANAPARWAPRDERMGPDEFIPQTVWL